MIATGPRVWALLSYRAGETSQILGLAEALRDLAGLDFEEKRIRPRPTRMLASLLRLSGRFGVDLERSSPLVPPWPDLLITAGAKNEPLARWIREQSGGRTRLVFLGRTWCPPETFDLVITTPQYRLPEHPRILHNPATITRVSEARLTEERARWSEIFADLPRPRIAVLVGGRSGAWCFGPQAADRLAAALETERERLGGSILVTTSSRTDRAAAERLERGISEPARVHLWHRDPRDANPYFGFLACADEIVVTGDSIAMLSEALATGLPVRVFDLGSGRLAMRRSSLETGGRTDQTMGTRAYRLLSALGPKRLGRDLRLAHEAMLLGGRAAWLGESSGSGKNEALDVRPRSVAAILEILGEEAT